jgi:hypothetical protein
MGYVKRFVDFLTDWQAMQGKELEGVAGSIQKRLDYFVGLRLLLAKIERVC